MMYTAHLYDIPFKLVAFHFPTLLLQDKLWCCLLSDFTGIECSCWMIVWNLLRSYHRFRCGPVACGGVAVFTPENQWNAEFLFTLNISQHILLFTGKFSENSFVERCCVDFTSHFADIQGIICGNQGVSTVHLPFASRYFTISIVSMVVWTVWKSTIAIKMLTGRKLIPRKFLIQWSPAKRYIAGNNLAENYLIL